MPSKLSRILKVIRVADEALDEIDQNIDLTRLIGVSNAQGPLARVIHDAVKTAARIGDTISHEPAQPVKQAKKKRSPARKQKQLRS